MSTYYPSHSPRPQPQVSIPAFPEPQRPYEQRQSYPAEPSLPTPDWEQYAEAANAQVDQYGNYSSGYSGYDDYEGGYGDETPSAPTNGSNGFLAPNPYSPSSSGSSYYPNGSTYSQPGPSYQQIEGSYDPYENRSDLMHRTLSYPDEYLMPSHSSYDLGGAGLSFPEPMLQRSSSENGHIEDVKKQKQHRPVHSDIGSAVSLQRHSSHASYAPSLQANVSIFFFVYCTFTQISIGFYR